MNRLTDSFIYFLPVAHGSLRDHEVRMQESLLIVSKYLVKDGIKCVHESKFAFNVEKGQYYIIGVDLKLGMNTNHYGTSFLIEKYQVNSSNTLT